MTAGSPSDPIAQGEGAGPAATPGGSAPVAQLRDGPPAAGFLVRAGNFFFRFRNGLFPLAFVAIALVTRPLAPFGSERWNVGLDALGIAVALAGQALRALVIGLAYIRRGGKDRRIHADDLVTGGLFAHSRNPLYLGNLMVFLGLFLVLNSVWGYLVGVSFFLFAYRAIVAAEEDFLRRRFGATFDDYCRRVNRFVPRFRGLASTIRGMSFNWKRLIRKEYGSAFAWITTALALLVWERFLRGGTQAAEPALRVALLAWAPVVAAYVLARVLKKTRRLE